MDTLFLVVGIVLYVLPGCIASIREHRNKMAIWALNIILGWTFLGWVVSFIWSLTNPSKESASEPVASNFKKCPYCAEKIKSEAVVCRFCNRDLK